MVGHWLSGGPTELSIPRLSPVAGPPSAEPSDGGLGRSHVGRCYSVALVRAVNVMTNVGLSASAGARLASACAGAPYPLEWSSLVRHVGSGLSPHTTDARRARGEELEWRTESRRASTCSSVQVEVTKRPDRRGGLRRFSARIKTGTETGCGRSRRRGGSAGGGDDLG